MELWENAANRHRRRQKLVRADMSMCVPAAGHAVWDIESSGSREREGGAGCGTYVYVYAAAAALSKRANPMINLEYRFIKIIR